ncbi:hypothetical protein [Hydrogenophaga sp. SL48]|uniref:hypothetical protein n=1 Tax=Hydrogenophaga sp. SL48 TaxID=2806347 RepID=UPI001F450D23|nr:hypothetical protein [Hydrogenophaga sp. SL48]UJW81806.1 hypothetical protein IM738_03550 [Hydrogenophaga sp. SL48]
MSSTSIQLERRTGLERAWQVLWLLIASAVLFSALNGKVQDRDWTPFSDQSSHLLAAMSVWHDRDLKFEKIDLDRFNARFPAAGGPKGTFLKQSPSGDFFYAKPVLYALLTAPFYGVFGTSGFILFNLLAIALMASLTFRIATPVYGAWQAHGMTAALFLLGPFMAWAMVIHPDILISALLFGGGYLLLTGHTRTALLAAGGLLGMALYEKPTFAVILPLLFLAMPSLSFRKMVLAALGVSVGWLLPTAINLSQDAHMLAYQGVRYGLQRGPFPFEAGWIPPLPLKQAHIFEPANLQLALQQNMALLPQKLRDFALGRQTGLIPYFPVALVFLFTAVAKRNRLSWMVCAGLAGYLLLNALAFPSNGFGGGQTYGSRYLMQALPLIVLALLPVDQRPPESAKPRWRRGARSSAAVIAIALTIAIQHRSFPPNGVNVENPTPFLTTFPGILFPLEESLLPFIPVYSPKFNLLSEGEEASLFLTEGFEHGTAKDKDGHIGMTFTVFLHDTEKRIPPIRVISSIPATMTANIGNRHALQGSVGQSEDPFIELHPTDLRHKAFDLLSGKMTRWGTVRVTLNAVTENSSSAFATVDFRRPLPSGAPRLDTDIGTGAFSSQGIETRFGWSQDPAWTQWIWTDGPYAELRIPVPAGVSSAMDVSVEAHSFLAPGHAQQQVEVYVDGQHLQDWKFDSPEPQRLLLTVDNAASKDAIRLGFKPLNPAVPHDLGLGKDMRKLGMALHSIRLANHSTTPTGKP